MIIIWKYMRDWGWMVKGDETNVLMLKPPLKHSDYVLSVSAHPQQPKQPVANIMNC